MKLLIKFLTVFAFFIPNHCYGQKRTGEVVQLINRNYKVDSLIFDIVARGSSEESKNAYFIIHINKVGGALYIDLGTCKKSEINLYMATGHDWKAYLGYFKLQNYRVFVISYQNFSDLFSATGKSTRIRLLNFSRVIDPNPLEINFLPETLIYQNGKFEPMYGNAY